MTTNFNTNHQLMKMKAKVNRPKIAKETSSGSTTSPKTSVNNSFLEFKNIFQTTIDVIKYSTKRIFSPLTFGLNMETYRISSHIHSQCGVIQARPTPNANTFHTVDVRTLLRYFNTIVL